MAKKRKTSTKTKTVTLILSVTDKDKDKVIDALTHTLNELGLASKAIIVIKPEYDIRVIEKGDNANVKA